MIYYCVSMCTVQYRNDHMYAYMRRQALQEYLKGIVKITGLTLKSAALQKFLELERNSMNAGGYESLGDKMKDKT